MPLAIRFPKQAPFDANSVVRRRKVAKDVINRLSGKPVEEPLNQFTPQAWSAQKPRMSSARIMIEVRRRLWAQACSETTGFYLTEKLLEQIKSLNKRIEKRVMVESQPLTKSEQTILDRLFESGSTVDHEKYYELEREFGIPQ